MDSATSTTASTSVQGALLVATEVWRCRDVVLLGVTLPIGTSSAAVGRCRFVMDDVDLKVRHLVRRNLVGSLPRGIPTVVDESVEVRMIPTEW